MGLILPQKVKVKISSANWKHFEELGYKIPRKIGDKNSHKCGRLLYNGQAFKVNYIVNKLKKRFSSLLSRFFLFERK